MWFLCLQLYYATSGEVSQADFELFVFLTDFFQKSLSLRQIRFSNAMYLPQLFIELLPLLNARSQFFADVYSANDTLMSDGRKPLPDFIC
ncbi:hypothetical protein WL26_24095 [Burkholderia cepacia]|nr:hypothetical protein WL26_24095 [Burkholderia cepacia]